MSQPFATPGEETLIEPELKVPPNYAVYLHNDNYTTMDFVVQVLKEVFFKKDEDAVALMLKVHQEGIAKVGSYIKEVAATKVHQVGVRAREAGFPLLCTMEEEE